MPEGVAVVAVETSAFMEREAKLLNNTYLRGWIQAVPKTIGEAEIRVDVSTSRSESRVVAVSFQIAVLHRACRSFQNLVKTNSAANVKRRGERRDVEMRSTCRATLYSRSSMIGERHMNKRAGSANRGSTRYRLFHRSTKLCVRSSAEVPRAVGLTIAHIVCIEETNAQRGPNRRLSRTRHSATNLRPGVCRESSEQYHCK